MKVWFVILVDLINHHFKLSAAVRGMTHALLISASMRHARLRQRRRRSF